jgi:putative heme-binding domain-containing protein
VLVPDGGATFKAERAPLEQATEFVRSSDNWFRPVNFVNAPDGTLHVLDLSREVLEAIHIPLDVVKHLDLRRGRDQGRIYRIAPKGFVYKAPPDLNARSTVELVALLKRPDAWYRDTAHRLIHERQDRAAVEPLRAIVSDPGFAFAPSRANALWSLEGLNALRDEDLLIALGDPEPRVRAQALILSEPRFDGNPALQDRALSVAADPDPTVRYQAAFSLGEMRNDWAVPALAAIARSDSADRWTRAAVLSSLATTADRMLVELLKDPEGSSFAGGFAAQSDFLGQLATIVGARNKAENVLRVLDAAAAMPDGPRKESLQRSIVLALGRGLNQAGGRLPAVGPADAGRPGFRLLSALSENSRRLALDAEAAESDRVVAIGVVGSLPRSEAGETFSELLEPRQPQAVQIAAVRALADSGGPEAGGLILERIRGFAPAVRSAAASALLRRPEWTKQLLRAIARPGGGLGVALIAPDQRGRLLKSRDQEIARLAGDVLGRTGARSRAQVIADYTPALRMPADASRGAKVFVRECRTCHKVDDQGFAVGPDLTGSPSRDPAALLVHILDPNQYVLPAYIQYVVTDTSGRTYSGMIAAETATSVTLRRGDNAQDVLLRGSIEEMAGTGQSLMPEGFEKTVSRQDMADLIAFLRASHRGGDGADPKNADDKPLDIGTLPGLIEPD